MKTSQKLNLPLTPIEAAERLRALPEFVFFDHAKSDGKADGISLLAAEPTQILRGKSEADWRALAAFIHKKSIANRHLSSLAAEQLSNGFAAGWIEYDGSFCFGIYDYALVFDHAAQRWNGDEGWWLARAQAANGERSRLADLANVERESFIHAEFQPEMPRADFLRMVERAKEYIAAGDIYQVNLAQRFSAPFANGDPWMFYRALRDCSPSAFAAYLAVSERFVLSSSPELFLKMKGRKIRTRPIKGTRPRGTDAASDALLERELIASPKETAELTMITDLERNDLGQVCEYGSVAVSEMLKLERHRQVFHLVSTVDGTLREEVDHVAALRACFPGGSITGAPKKRAMEIIAELEPASRGLYTGAIGYFGFNGESQFSIAIRTAIVENGVAHFHVGSGIVADSVPEEEYAETLHKAAGILSAARRLKDGR